MTTSLGSAHFLVRYNVLNLTFNAHFSIKVKCWYILHFSASLRNVLLFSPFLRPLTSISTKSLGCVQQKGNSFLSSYLLKIFEFFLNNHDMWEHKNQKQNTRSLHLESLAGISIIFALMFAWLKGTLLSNSCSGRLWKTEKSMTMKDQTLAKHGFMAHKTFSIWHKMASDGTKILQNF